MLDGGQYFIVSIGRNILCCRLHSRTDDRFVTWLVLCSKNLVDRVLTPFEQDVGWMKVEYEDVAVGMYYCLRDLSDDWRREYRRPPEVARALENYLLSSPLSIPRK